MFNVHTGLIETAVWLEICGNKAVWAGYDHGLVNVLLENESFLER